MGVDERGCVIASRADAMADVTRSSATSLAPDSACRTDSPQATLPCLTVIIVIVIITPSGQLRSFRVIVTPGSRTALLCVSISCLIYSKTDRVASTPLYLFIPPRPYSLPALSHSTLNRSTLNHA